MKKVSKYFLYTLACVALFLVFVKIFGSAPNSVSAFEWEKTVKIYFANRKMGSNEDCTKVFPVVRIIPNAETLGPGALSELLSGVTEKEKNDGYLTSLNDEILIQKFEIKDQVAYVDFNSRFNEKVAGACYVQSIKSQIETTLNSLADIDAVVMSVNGETEGILEP